MNRPNIIKSKGHKMEELLRLYFIKLGYYVARGVPFTYGSFNVTDIDLWVYSRISPISREISIVDVKNKKTPQAIERIFWVQGLKQAVKASNAIVATTDKRLEVKNFGQELGVLVLDGLFLSKLDRFEVEQSARLTDEEFYELINTYKLSKLDGDWKGRLVFSKGLLAQGLSFNACNSWIDQAHFFAEQVIIKPQQKEVSLRCLYLILSFVLLAIDYNSREISFLEPLERSKQLTNYFTYGSLGNIGFKQLVEASMGLVESYAKDGKSISSQVRSNVEGALKVLRTKILGEYFAKVEILKSAFGVALELEGLAMSRQFKSHALASVELRGTLSCFLDYWGIDRVKFSDATQEN
jgi:hypothetical protein